MRIDLGNWPNYGELLCRSARATCIIAFKAASTLSAEELLFAMAIFEKIEDDDIQINEDWLAQLDEAKRGELIQNITLGHQPLKPILASSPSMLNDRDLNKIVANCLKRIAIGPSLSSHDFCLLANFLIRCMARIDAVLLIRIRCISMPWMSYEDQCLIRLEMYRAGRFFDFGCEQDSIEEISNLYFCFSEMSDFPRKYSTLLILQARN